MCVQHYVRDARARGQTRLYDAIKLGVEQLLPVREMYGGCLCRLLVLSDGEDQNSRTSCIQVHVLFRVAVLVPLARLLCIVCSAPPLPLYA